MDRYPLEGFAERLRELWFASEKTQEEVACRVGVDRETFAGWIYMDSMLDALHTARLCMEFHVSADYLLFGRQTDGESWKGNNGDGTEKGE
ncbi:MAG: helix-turn-helix transcriptional regulator [Lachnospiraceae bacterium]|nr:helix-turn-helix transcriptional regulator [Lachnospiraceae bacterium]